MVQPGAILHGVIDGAFRSMRSGIDTWYRETEVYPSTAPNATYGQSAGDQALREQIIEAAGRDVQLLCWC